MMDKQQLVNTDEFKSEAKWMFTELQNWFLNVTLSGPIDDWGRKLRIVNNRNPEWYSELFNQYAYGDRRGKGSRSIVRRYMIIPIIKNLSEGIMKNTSNYNIIFDLIKDRLFNGYEVENTFVPPILKED